MSVKWHNMKAVLRYSEGIDQPIVTPQWPMLFDLASDPNELYNIMATKMDMGWMLGVALKFVGDYHKSVAQYPNVKTGEELEAGTAAVIVLGESKLEEQLEKALARANKVIEKQVDADADELKREIDAAAKEPAA